MLENGDIRRAFLKDLDPRQFGNELFVAALAEHLKVPVPDAAIVLVPLSVCDQFRKIHDHTGDNFIAFGSIDASGSTVAQVFDELGSLDTPLRHIKSSPMLGQLYGLDTWIANIDRHANNLIVRGDGQVFLIDHGHCFSGPAWSPSDLDANKSYDCRLREWLTPRLEQFEKDEAMADVKKVMSAVLTKDMQEIVVDCLASNLYGATDTDAVIGFLEARISHVESLAATALETV